MTARELFDHNIKIDLRKKTVSFGKTTLNKSEIEPVQTDNFLEDLMELYNDFKYSYPNNGKNTSRYFKSLTAEEMTDVQLATGKDRLECKKKIELFALLANVKWSDFADPNMWWYKVADTDLVLLRDWFC